MATYVCTNLVGNVCTNWEQAQLMNGLDYLAITQQQASELLIASLSVVFSAWLIRQVLNVILQRRY